MDLVTLISTGKSLLELGQEISSVVKKAQSSSNVVESILLFLDAAQAAVAALGHERQSILTDVRSCDVGEQEQVNALWKRLDRYLHENNIRPQLENAIGGLGKCRGVIQVQTQSAWWRKQNKEAAVKEFSETLDELDLMLQGLTSNFYPGGSGMGIQTLVPILELVASIQKAHRTNAIEKQELQKFDEQLSELAKAALRDESHESWIHKGAKVESLIVELKLAFSVKIVKAVSNDS